MPYKDLHCEAKKETDREAARRYYWKNAEKMKACNRECHAKTREQVLSYYSHGEMKCAICGESDIVVLCIDHIDNNGAKQKKAGFGSSFYAWLKKNDYPEGFQVLCHNCNFRKEYIRRQVIYLGGI